MAFCNHFFLFSHAYNSISLISLLVLGKNLAYCKIRNYPLPFPHGIQQTILFTLYTLLYSFFLSSQSCLVNSSKFYSCCEVLWKCLIHVLFPLTKACCLFQFSLNLSKHLPWKHKVYIHFQAQQWLSFTLFCVIYTVVKIVVSGLVNIWKACFCH